MDKERLPGNGMQQKRGQSSLKSAYNRHKYIRVIYINKGGSILFNIINIPVFLCIFLFFFSSYSSQRNTHSPLSKDKGIQKIKLTLQTLDDSYKINFFSVHRRCVQIIDVCGTHFSIRHIPKAKPDMEKGDNKKSFPFLSADPTQSQFGIFLPDPPRTPPGLQRQSPGQPSRAQGLSLAMG